VSRALLAQYVVREFASSVRELDLPDLEGGEVEDLQLDVRSKLKWRSPVVSFISAVKIAFPCSSLWSTWIAR
jgi:hypothetical protein